MDKRIFFCLCQMFEMSGPVTNKLFVKKKRDINIEEGYG